MMDVAHALLLLLVACAGVAAGSVLALVPGLHLYNLAGAALLWFISQRAVAPDQFAWFLGGALIGWSVVHVVPSIFLFAPDDNNVMYVLPATRYMLQGRGVEAAILTGAGSVSALLCLVALAPVLEMVLRPVYLIIQPHVGWMLVAVIAFLLLGEWPRANERAPSPLARLASAWAYVGSGLLTFALSGLLGMVLFYRSPIAPQVAFQNLMPAFVGLFALPGLVQLAALSRQPPPQQQLRHLELPPRALVRGASAGIAGGLFASLMPIVTGGIGGLLAGHATALRDERTFMISLGASRVAYFVGSWMLLFVPGLALTRGGLAWMITTVYVPQGWQTYWLWVATVALGGALAFGLLVVLARLVAQVTHRLPVRLIAALCVALMLAATAAFTGPSGIAVALVASAIGLLPVLIGGRRLNGLGVLLVPITLNVLGIGPQVAAWLGLR